MRKMMVIVFVICFIATGCTSGDVTVTSAQIQDLFEKHGVLLTKQTEINPNAVFSTAYNNITPEQFMTNNHQNISVYIYPTSKEAKKGLEDFEDSWAAAEVESHSAYQIANVLIFYVTDRESKDDRVEMVIEELKSITK